MRILFISFYYPPDLCAGSFRAGALVQALSRKLSINDEIDVITTLPNRYASYDVKAPEREQQGLVRISRIPIPSHQGGMVDQSFAFARFAANVLREVSVKQYDLVFATTSRLMTGALGSVIARRVGAPLYLDIRDIFTDTMANLLSGKLLSGMLPVFRWVERHTVRSASRINLVSEGFISYFESITDKRKFVFFPNGVDEEFLAYDFHKTTIEEHPTILYAGNIGAGQGLHRIVPGVAKCLEEECQFLVVGDGGMRQELEEGLEAAGVTNVRMLDPVPRSKLLELYAEADYLLLHLNDHEAFRRVLPSKLFEYAATGKPILAGVAGYSGQFIREYVDHAAVFDPCDVEGFTRAYRSLKPSIVDRGQFVRRFRRKTIMDRLAEDILLQCSSRITSG